MKRPDFETQGTRHAMKARRRYLRIVVDHGVKSVRMLDVELGAPCIEQSGIRKHGI